MIEIDPLAEEVVFNQGVDATPAMRARRWLSTEAAGEPDQYDTALKELIRHLGAPLRTLVDVGCNSGEFVIGALERARHLGAMGIGNTRTYGTDVLPKEKATHFLMQPLPSYFAYREVPVHPPHIPLGPGEKADGVLALNVLFRIPDPKGMLVEIGRVLRPGGITVISSNFENHAKIRHGLTRVATTSVLESQRPDQLTAPWPPVLQPPAEGAYYHHILNLARTIPGLTIVGEIVQDASLKVTSENIAEYIIAMQLEAPRTNLSPDLHITFRAKVAELAENYLKAQGGSFIDPIHRGILVARKSA